MATVRYRDICFTSFKEDPPEYGATGVFFLTYQQECCPSTKKFHWQGFAQSTNAKTTSAWQTALNIGKAHCEPRKGPVAAAIAYCQKDDSKVPDTFESHGTPKSSTDSGKRNDLVGVKRLLDAGIAIDDIMEQEEYFGSFAKYDKFFRTYASHAKRRKSFSPPIVTVVFGPTGTNKTKRFFDDCDYKDFWDWHPGMGQWFDGYSGQSNVLFDEFRGQLPYGLLLKLVDGYPLRLPIKGGFVHWAPKKITFTSPTHPNEWYPNLARNDKLDQLFRRINKVDFSGLEDDESAKIADKVENHFEWEQDAYYDFQAGNV